MIKNFVRIIVAALLGIAFFSALLILVEKSPLIYAAYAWSVWALIIFAFGLGCWAQGRKNKYILHAAYPLLIQSYTAVTILLAVIFSALSLGMIWEIPWGWFCLIEFAVFAVAAWKLQALDAGKDAIVAVEEKVKVNTVDWKVLTADISAIAERASAADKKQVTQAMEAVRFADPMAHEAVADIVEKLKTAIYELGSAVDSSDSAKITELCTAIDRLVKERSNKLMLLK